MTPTELRDAINTFAKDHDVKVFNLSVGLDLDSNTETPCRATYWPNGIGSDTRSVMRVYADTWFNLLFKIKGMVLEAKDKMREERLRKLAMAIIDIHDGGNADITDRDLRLKGFSQAEIDDLGGLACVEAFRLGRGPFFIVTTEAANAA